MKIKSLKIINNIILGNLNIDFTDKNGKIINSIIIAGENGTGKSTLLNIIYEFTNYNLVSIRSDEKREFVVEFSDEEINALKQDESTKSYFQKNAINNEYTFKFDYSILNNWDQVKISYISPDGDIKSIPGHFFTVNDRRKIIKAIYSDVEINFSPQNIKAITSKNIDEEIFMSKKSTQDLATEVCQLLVDIQALDAEDFMQWAKKNIHSQIDENMINIRMKRFKDAFDFMFETKKYIGVNTESSEKKVIFEEYGKEVSLDKLSSGEKQIIFRGSFLLKDKNSSKGAIVLIDEPEISLHPNWQLKILDYYKRLFTDESATQTSQIFFVTHSPFIIHNSNRNNDKVFILKKDKHGNVYNPREGKFYSWSDEQIVEEAFNLNSYKSIINESEKHLIITEGKTDWKHLKRALIKLRQENKISSDDFEFLEYENQFNMGDKELISFCEQFSKINNNKKLICVFDRDVPDTIKKVTNNNSYKEWGNNVYSFAIPVPKHRENTPDISIEHYYTDDEIKIQDEHGRRIYLGNEFYRKSGLHISEKKFCVKKDKCGSDSIKVLDSDCGVYSTEDEDRNIALSKNQFADYIYNQDLSFSNLSYSAFEDIFQVIRQILDN